MGWTILLGVAVLAGLGAAGSEFDNIPLETSPSGFSRKSAPRPIYTASYGVAPGEYVLRGSDSSGHAPAPAPVPVQGFSFLPRDQAPPQEYLDLLRQTGTANGASQAKQQKGTSRVIDQQYFGVQPNPPYPASGPSPVLSPVPNQVQNTRVVISTTPFPPTAPNQAQILNIAPNPQYPATGTSPVTALNVSPKPSTPSRSRSNQGSGSASAPGRSRQGAGKAVQLSYSLDYDLRTLHRIEESAGGASDSASSTATYYPSEPGTSVRGNEELLNQLVPRPPPIPFLPSYDSEERKSPKTKSENAENDKDKIEIIKLPSPKGQRPITQEELLELVRAGYDVRPVENTPKVSPQTTQQPPQRGYQRAKAPENQLQLPKSRGLGSSPSRPVFFSTADFQDPIPQRQTYVTNPGTAPSARGTASRYYQTPAVPLPLIRQQNVQPQVQAYQPGRSGIQQVQQQQQQQEQQNYQKEAEPQPQVYQSADDYVSQNYPSSAEEQQPQQEYTAGAHSTESYPTAAAQQSQEYQQISAGQQAQIYQQPSAPQVQIYQQPQSTQAQNEALSQPKEYIIPAPQRSKTYHTRVNQGYQQTSPSATGSDEAALNYQQALGEIPQGYEAVPTAPGATAPGVDIQRTQPRYRGRNSRRRHESRITYIQRFEGEPTAYSKEQ